jgi:hypothetical protein
MYMQGIVVSMFHAGVPMDCRPRFPLLLRRLTCAAAHKPHALHALQLQHMRTVAKRWCAPTPMLDELHPAKLIHGYMTRAQCMCCLSFRCDSCTRAACNARVTPGSA